MPDELVLMSLDVQRALESAIESLVVMKVNATEIAEITRIAVQIADLRAEVARVEADRLAHIHEIRVMREPTPNERAMVRASIDEVLIFSVAAGQVTALIQLVTGLLDVWSTATA